MFQSFDIFAHVNGLDRDFCESKSFDSFSESFVSLGTFKNVGTEVLDMINILIILDNPTKIYMRNSKKLNKNSLKYNMYPA